MIPTLFMVWVKPGAKVEKVEKTEMGFRVWVKSRPVNGEANRRLLEVLAEYLSLPKSRLKILHGKTGRVKRVAVLPDKY